MRISLVSLLFLLTAAPLVVESKRQKGLRVAKGKDKPEESKEEEDDDKPARKARKRDDEPMALPAVYIQDEDTMVHLTPEGEGPVIDIPVFAIDSAELPSDIPSTMPSDMPSSMPSDMPSTAPSMQPTPAASAMPSEDRTIYLSLDQLPGSTEEQSPEVEDVEIIKLKINT